MLFNVTSNNVSHDGLFDLASSFNVVNVGGYSYEARTWLGKTRNGALHIWYTEFFRLEFWQPDAEGTPIPATSDRPVMSHVSNDTLASVHLEWAVKVLTSRLKGR